MGKLKAPKTDNSVVVDMLKERKFIPKIKYDEDMVYIMDDEGYCRIKRRKDVAENETIITRKEYLERVVPPEWRLDNEK